MSFYCHLFFIKAMKEMLKMLNGLNFIYNIYILSNILPTALT